MDYQERIKLVTGAVNTFLRQFVRPAHLTDETAISEIRGIAEEINALIASDANSDELAARVQSCLRGVRRSAKSREWPLCQAFVSALRDLDKTAGHSGGSSKPAKARSAEAPDSHLERVAAEMNAGQPVGDGFLYGAKAVQLVRLGLVSQDVLQSYRDGLRRMMASRISKEYADAMVSRLEARHETAVAGPTKMAGL